MSDAGRLLLELQNVDVALPEQDVLFGITLRIHKGQHTAILGGNGAGKSTLLKLIRGDAWPHFANGGRRIYHFDDEPQESVIGVRERIAIVSAEQQQNYSRQEWNISAGDVIRAGFVDRIYLQEQLTTEQENRVQEVARLLSAAHLLRRSMLTLSVGEARRILVARALVSRPVLLLLDEVCNGLDADSRDQLLAQLSALARSGETTLVQTTHHEKELLPDILQVISLSKGRIVGAGPNEPEAPAIALPMISAPPVSTKPTGAILFSVENADVEIDGAPILHGINWTMRPHENWAILGHNGSGKTTFLKLLHGDVTPVLGGEVHRFDLPPGSSVWDARRLMGYVGNELQASYAYNITGEEAVLSGFFSSIGIYQDITPQQRERAAQVIAQLRIENLAAKRIHHMSYGEFRKLLIARALVGNPRVLLLDEPCNGLDATSRDVILDLLSELASKLLRIVMVTHHEEEIIPQTTHVAVMRAGRMISQTSMGSVLPIS
ncbi:ATP-binding cassette domain-containing protein [soil metagenome]